MAHFARINKNTNQVLEVLVVNNEDINNLEFPDSEPVGIAFLQPWSTEDTYWKQTSYNANFRKNYAGIEYTYDPQRDAFISPSPYPSWVLNENTYLWEPPILYPNDGKRYVWEESTKSWKEMV